MDQRTRARVNSLRGDMLKLSVHNQQMPKRDALVAYSSGMAEAYLARRKRSAAARAKAKAARAARKRNRG